MLKVKGGDVLNNSTIVRGWRTRDAAYLSKARLFPDDELDDLEKELADIEERLRNFAEHVRAANLRRPTRRNGFYSSTCIATLGGRTEWLYRVRRWLHEERWRIRCYAPVSSEATREERV
jgi:hypothetical protein